MSDASTTQESIMIEPDGGVARVTLNRPDTLNAWGHDLGAELLPALRDLSADPEVRAVLITGSGRAFCSGADLKGGFEPNADGKPDVHTPLTEIYNPSILEIRKMPKPVIAAVNGPAAGVGCSLALACDLVLAAESSYFLLAFANIGLVPDGGASAFVPARAGVARAAEMAMLGERVPAAKALDWGLCNRVVADQALMDEASALAAKMAAGPTLSYANTKRMLNRRLYSDLAEQLALEAELQQQNAASEDFVAGVTAFVTKQPPEFKGR